MFHSRPARKVRAYRPRLEVLEDRTLLSTYLVDHLADDAAGTGLNGSLRYAISHAVDGDAINFGVTGTINLNSALPVLTHNISINGPGADLLTVRRDAGFYSVFSVRGVVVVSGLTIANGLAEKGGGIFDQGSLTLNNVAISGNSAGEGGGIAVEVILSALTLNNVTVSGNSANLAGGGIWNLGGTVTINNSTISGNSADSYGGGIGNHLSVLTLSNSTVSGNSAAFGGGIWNTFEATLSNSTVSGNSAASGGGILNTDFLTLSNSTVSGNSAASGGGIWNSYQVTLSNSTVSGNSAASGGGILNTASFDTGIGGVFTRNTIIDDVYGGDNGGLESNGYNLIGHASGDTYFVATDLIGVNPLLGPLQNNGGPTQTMALLAGSPALNSGDPAQLGVPDQRGVARRGGVNRGAYQASASAFVLTVPATVTAGTPFNLTVKAVDPFGQTALGYTGTVTFSTSDTNPAVVLPANYTFTTADAGLHTFTGGATLASAGSQTLTATDTATAALTGSATVSVTPAAANHFVISAPASVSSGTAFDVTVTVVDAYGNTVPTYLGTVHFSTTDPDPRVILPADYVFMAADRGKHTFSGGATLYTTGDETIRVTDTLDNTLTGSLTVTL